MAPLVPFVGRKAELDSLIWGAGQARIGRGRFVLIAGEAGVGKTRLCGEFADTARDAGMLVGWTACWEDGALPAYWPVIQLCDQVGVTVDRPEWRDDPGSARASMFAAVVTGLRAVSQRQPCVLIVDDLQWADADTRRLVAFLASAVRVLPVLMVATVRADDRPRSVLAELRRHASVVELQGLDTAQLRVLAIELMGTDPPAGLIDRLYRLTSGNPLFASELLIQMQASSDQGPLSERETIRLPPTVRAVLDDRLGSLSGETRAVLQVAAIVGAVFDAALVAAASNQADDVAIGEVGRAADAGVVVADGVGRFRFAHPLFRSVLINDLGVARRTALHRRVADVLASSPRERDRGWLEAVASHYLAAAPAGAASQAVAFGERAARAALDALAYDQAAELFGRVLDVDRLEPGHADRLALLLAAGQARIAAGDLDRGRATLMPAADLARDAGRVCDLAVAALGLAGAGFEVPLFDRIQVSLLEEAHALVPPDDVVLRSRVAARLSVALSLSEDSEERRRVLAEDAVQLATACGDEATLAQALAARCDVLAGPDQRDERASDARTIVRLAEARRDVGTELVGRRLAVVAAFEAGDMTAVDAEIAGFAALADALAQPQYRWYVHLWRATRAIMRGRLLEYGTDVARAETLGREAGSVNCDILIMSQRWFAALELGDPAAALMVADERVPLGRWSEMGPQMLPLDVGRRFFANRLDEARAILDAGFPAMRAAPVDAEWLTMVAEVGVLAADLSAVEHLPWIYDALIPYAELWSLDGIGAYSHGPVHRQLGIIAAALGRAGDAAEHFEIARRINERAGADLLVARTLLDRGRSLSDQAALIEARDRYAALGVDGHVEDIAGSGTGGSAATPGGATFRRSGEHWQIGLDGTLVSLQDSKGMHDLAALLAHPGREIAAVDLAAPGGTLVSGSTGPAIDEQARGAYKRRIIELEQQLDDADMMADIARSTRLTEERDALLGQLAGAYGIGGRARRAADPAERARTAVTARIRDAIRRIERHHPTLGRHLNRSVRTGTFCAYDPEQPIHWEL